MSALTVLILGDEPVRARAGVIAALASRALGDPTTLFFDAAAVPLARADRPLADLLADAIDAGVAVSVCQSGMADHGIAHGELVAGIEAGGMVGTLSGAREGRMLSV